MLDRETFSRRMLISIHRAHSYNIVDFTKNVLNLELWPEQARILKEFYSSEKKELMLILGKKSGKTFMASVVALYEVYKLLLMTNPQRHYKILPSQTIYILNVCAGKGQAIGIFLDFVKAMVKGSNFLKFFLSQVPLSDEVRFKKNIVIKSQSSSSRSSLGFACITVLFDELAWFLDTSGNASGKAVYQSLRPNINPFGKDGKSVIFSSPGTKKGIFFELKEFAEKSENMMVFQKATWEMNPNITRNDLKEEFLKDPEKAMMDFEGKFMEPAGSGLNSEKIDACIKHEVIDINVKDWSKTMVIALDPGLKHDAYALAMGHKREGKIVIDYCHRWQGTSENPVQIEEVENHIRFLKEQFNVTLVCLDQHQSASTIQRLSKEGIPIEETHFTATYNVTIYNNLKEKINSEQIEFPKFPRLIAEMKAIQRTGAGEYAKYNAPTTGSITTDDMVDAVANCAFQLEKLENIGSDVFVLDGVENTKFESEQKEEKKEKEKREEGGKEDGNKDDEIDFAVS